MKRVDMKGVVVAIAVLGAIGFSTWLMITADTRDRKAEGCREVKTKVSNPVIVTTRYDIFICDQSAQRCYEMTRCENE